MPEMLSRVANLLAYLTRKTGEISRWLALAMVVVTGTVVAGRYAFDYSSIALQETVMYLHASLFMLGAAYTWQLNGHVRVDIFYQNFSPASQRRVDLFGTLFLLLPTCGFLLWSSWSYVDSAWTISEKSQEAGGLPFVYGLKTLILVMPILMLLEACNQLIRLMTASPAANNSESDQHV